MPYLGFHLGLSMVGALYANAASMTISALLMTWSLRRLFKLLHKHTEDICLEVGRLAAALPGAQAEKAIQKERSFTIVEPPVGHPEEKGN